MVGLLGVADPVKPDAPEAMRALKAVELRMIGVTGDSRVTAQAVARRLESALRLRRVPL